MAVAAVVAVVALVSPTANATPICRWVDKAGRTQVASVVPEPYKAVATCTDSQQYELSPEQRHAAEQGAAEHKARAAIEAARRPTSSASSPLRPAGPAPRPDKKRPLEVVTEATDCPTWWRLYDESAECFGPYRTVRGAIKSEAFDVCKVVPSPAPKCGPRSH